jgi:hypothetical protein
MRTLRICLAAALLLLVGTATAVACSIALEAPLTPHIARADVRSMHQRTGARGAWVQSTSWKSFPVTINQRIQLDGMDEPIDAAFAQQRSIRLVSFHPGALVARYTEDDDPATTCALAGQQVWSTPKVLVHETTRAIFITTVMRRTEGSTEGCGIVASSCDDLMFRRIVLDAPIGARELYSVRFS